MDTKQIIKKLEKMANPEAAKGMESYGITNMKVLGVKVPDLRKIARELGKNHELAMKLWAENIRETRIIASIVDEPELVTEEQMDCWAEEFTNWEVCDQCCMNLFEKTPYAYKKCYEWSSSDGEFVKRAGFVMMARMAVSDKKADNDCFIPFFAIIRKEAHDKRNMVKKAINWALRQIGKRNLTLNKLAIETAEEIKAMDSPASRWVASDAIRELAGEAVQERLKMKEMKRKQAK